MSPSQFWRRHPVLRGWRVRLWEVIGLFFAIQAVGMLVIALATSGCATAPSSGPDAGGDPRLVLAPGLPAAVEIESLQASRNSAGVLVVNPTLLNGGRGEIPIRYRVEWLVDGAPAAVAPSRWTATVLRPREPVTLSLVAPQLAITQFRLLIEPAP